MNIVEIQDAVNEIAGESFDHSQFIFDFMKAYDADDVTIKQLQAGKKNESDLPDGVLWKRQLHYSYNPTDGLNLGLERIATTPKTKKFKCRFALTTDGADIAAKDLQTGESLFCALTELGDKFAFFLPLAGYDRFKEAEENPVDIKATGKLEKFYHAIVAENPDWARPERQHDLNQFITRIIFCLFAEDTGIFAENLFTKTLTDMGGQKGGQAQFVLQIAFEVMNLPKGAERDSKPEWARDFPYVNGGLFSGARDAPKLNANAYRHLLDAGSGLDWRHINPDIFGSMIQSIVNDEMRGELGMHYTSVPNILKVLEPLFLDSLQADLQKAYDSRKGLEKLLTRLSKIRVFDPACGSGNFLVIAYQQLRGLEIEVVKRLTELSKTYTPSLWSVIDLKNFYGIEYADFAAETAKLSLWIAEYQMNSAYRDVFHHAPPALPLREGGNIRAGNALRVDWTEVCPYPMIEQHKSKMLDLATITQVQDTELVPDPDAETYLVGNPPYLGSQRQTEEQKEDMFIVFDGKVRSYKSIDYVGAWFAKATDYITTTNSKCAFVATNSLVQGRQASSLWPFIFGQGMEVDYAYTSFKWKNNALNKAAVIVVVVALRRVSDAKKYIFDGEFKRNVGNINAYLLDGPNTCILASRKPVFSVPVMTFGSMPNDGGNLILSEKERADFLEEDNDNEKYIKKFLGSREYIQGQRRFCLWLNDQQFQEGFRSKLIEERVEKVRQVREASDRPSTKKLAKKTV